MTSIEFVQQIRTQCKFLENDGYKFHHQTGRIWYSKADVLIAFNYSLYDYIDVYGLTAYKRFDSIEYIFEKVLQSPLEDLYTIRLGFDSSNLIGLIDPGKLPTRDHYHFEISQDAHIVSYGRLLQQLYLERILPFFETFDALHRVNNWISAHPVDAHENLIVSHGNSMVLRRIMIMYQAADPNYASLLSEYKAHLKSKSDQTPFASMYQNLLVMEQYLIQPSF